MRYPTQSAEKDQPIHNHLTASTAFGVLTFRSAKVTSVHDGEEKAEMSASCYYEPSEKGGTWKQMKGGNEALVVLYLRHLCSEKQLSQKYFRMQITSNIRDIGAR